MITLAPELSAYSVIPFAIGLDLVLPEPHSGLGDATAFGAGMPEASVDEERQSIPREIEVGVPKYVRRVLCPAAHLLVREARLDPLLGGHVAGAADLSHERRAFRLAQRVGQVIILPAMPLSQSPA